jgi:hypothetical protein
MGQPACNFTGKLSLPSAPRTYPFDDPPSTIIMLQAKTVLFPRGDGDWSFGGVASGARDTGAAHGRTAFQAFNVTGLASWYPRDEFEIDLNLGVSYLYGSGSFAVAGAAVQCAPIDAVQLLGEIFRDEPGRAKIQVGLRGIVVPDRFEVYVSYGNRFDTAQWFRPSESVCNRQSSRVDIRARSGTGVASRSPTPIAGIRICDWLLRGLVFMLSARGASGTALST